MRNDIPAGAAAYASGLSQSSWRGLRFQGLLTEGHRDCHGYYVYTPADVARVKLAATLMEHGASPKDAARETFEKSRIIAAIVEMASNSETSAHVYGMAALIDGRSCKIGDIKPIADLALDKTRAATIQINLTLIARSVIERLDEFERRNRAMPRSGRQNCSNRA